jgi:hypothetical protein
MYEIVGGAGVAHLDLAQGGRAVQHLRKFSVVFGLAAAGAMTLAITAGTTAAGAATRFRSGGARAQLVDATHATANGSAGALGLTGPNVMAAVVGLMAVLAMVFLVVTLVRRRVTLS